MKEKKCLRCQEPIERDRIGRIYKWIPAVHFECRRTEIKLRRAAYRTFYFKAYKRPGSHYEVTAFSEAYPLWFLEERLNV